MAYETRYCAYADILGFKNIVAGLAKGDPSYKDLRDTLRKIYSPSPSIFSIHQDSDLRAQSISDAVCLSTTCSAHGLSHLFENLELLTIELLKKGYFLRGAVVKGKLFHDDGIVFGEASVRAFELENTVARFPRIMIAKEVRADAAAYRDDGEMNLTESIQPGADGPHNLNVLRIMKIALILSRDAARKTHAVGYNKIAEQIQRRFDESVDDPRHFEKVQWFARYWNEVATDYSQVVRLIMGPGLGIMYQPMDEA